MVCGVVVFWDAVVVVVCGVVVFWDVVGGDTVLGGVVPAEVVGDLVVVDLEVLLSFNSHQRP